MSTQPSNFTFLAAHDPQLVRLGSLAERYFKDDPGTCLIKLRQFGELLAQLTAAIAGHLRAALLEIDAFSEDLALELTETVV